MKVTFRPTIIGAHKENGNTIINFFAGKPDNIHELVLTPMQARHLRSHLNAVEYADDTPAESPMELPCA